MKLPGQYKTRAEANKKADELRKTHGRVVVFPVKGPAGMKTGPFGIAYSAKTTKRKAKK